jgi:S-adenosylmethionine:tRNA ribosyltransferase-isomerase
MNLNIHDYTYTLPAERIALYPLSKRDDAKLLIYKKGIINHEKFSSLSEFLPEDTLLVFNDTKVIPARLNFLKDTGANIELFLLNPVLPSNLMIQVMEARNTCTWKCAIGNLKRWTGQPLTRKIHDIALHATLLNREEGIVEFRWTGNAPFAEVINLSGETPLPPYLKRAAEPADRERYQTIYSHHEGAVAAPTAGLHFTEAAFKSLEAKRIIHDFVTLHVSAGTFQPVKTENAIDHTMHREQITITRQNVGNLMDKSKFIVPVGTTSMRTLESIYWYGVKLLENEHAEFEISQTDPYTLRTSIPTKTEALQAVLRMMEKEKSDSITGNSSIYIYPGYTFKMCQAIITNFHQPGSTLILLIAAFAGSNWRKIYDEALNNNYRFLSYGDSSLIIP